MKNGLGMAIVVLSMIMATTGYAEGPENTLPGPGAKSTEGSENISPWPGFDSGIARTIGRGLMDSSEEELRRFVLLPVFQTDPSLQLRAQAAFRLLVAREYSLTIPVLIQMLEKDPHLRVFVCTGFPEASGFNTFLVCEVLAATFNYPLEGEATAALAAKDEDRLRRVIDKFKTWWEANSKQSPDSWARSQINQALLALEGEEQKGKDAFSPQEAIFYLTYNSDIYKNDLDVFRNWWGRVAKQPRDEWIREAVDKALADLEKSGIAETPDDICKQWNGVLELLDKSLLENIFLDDSFYRYICFPIKDPPAGEVQQIMKARLLEWWNNNREEWRFVPQLPLRY